jgi:hypothetical protein
MTNKQVSKRNTVVKMIADITEDIRALQSERGSYIVFDPNSEASRLFETRRRLFATLDQIDNRSAN